MNESVRSDQKPADLNLHGHSKMICNLKKTQTQCDYISNMYTLILWERSGSVVECLTRDRRAAVQPRKNRPYITERLLMGRKESNQTNKQTSTYIHIYGFSINFLRF